MVGINYKYGRTSGIRYCQIRRCLRCADSLLVSFRVIDFVQTKLVFQWVSMQDYEPSQQCCRRSQWGLLGGYVHSYILPCA